MRGALAQKIFNIHHCTPYNVKELWKPWIPEQVLTRARKTTPQGPHQDSQGPPKPPRTPPAAPKPPQEHPNQAPKPPDQPKSTQTMHAARQLNKGEARHRMHTKRMSAAAQKQFWVPKATQKCRNVVLYGEQIGTESSCIASGLRNLIWDHFLAVFWAQM